MAFIRHHILVCICGHHDLYRAVLIHAFGVANEFVGYISSNRTAVQILICLQDQGIGGQARERLQGHFAPMFIARCIAVGDNDHARIQILHERPRRTRVGTMVICLVDVDVSH